MAHHVFISYSQKDKNAADALCHRLEEDGIRCWIAPRDIAPGANWAESIANAIAASVVLVLIFSANANKSNQVIREVEMAINHGIILIPLRIEDVMPTGSMSYYLSATHWIDAFNSKMGSKFQLISDRIKILLSETPSEKKEALPQTQSVKNKGARTEEQRTAGKSERFTFTPLRILATVLIVACIGTAAVFLPGLLGGREREAENSLATAVPTPIQTAEMMSTQNPYEAVIHFDDATLENAIIQTLAAKGEYQEGQPLTKKILLKLNYLVIVPEASVEAFRSQLIGDDNVAEFDARVLITNDTIFSLSGLEYADNLSQLIIIDNNISNIQSLSGHSDLQSVHLDGNRISDLSPLSSVPSLREIHMSDNLVEDVSVLTGLPNLKNLDLSHNKISDISTIGRLIFLEDLSLESNNISDISALGSLRHLKNLNLSTNKVRDILPLATLDSLISLYLANNNINNIDALGELQALEWLDLSGNQSISSISVLSQLKTLKRLWLANDSISDISPIDGFVAMQILSLSNNDIVDLMPLEYTWIQELRIDGNMNIDGSVKMLNSLSELKTLYVETNLYSRYYDDVFRALKEKGVTIYDPQGTELD